MTKALKTYSLHNYKEIPQMSRLPEEMIEAIEVVGRVLPFKSNNYVVEELIDWEHIETDPMFTLTFPRKEMLEKRHYNTIKHLLDKGVSREVIQEKVNEIRLSLNPNPAGQEKNVPMLGDVKLRGVQHKYPETV